MEYLFLKRKKSTLRSERQKDLLFKAAERHWDEQFAGQGIVGRKVDCYIYKCILYQYIKNCFLTFRMLKNEKIKSFFELTPIFFA